MTNTSNATELARQVLPVFARAYPRDRRLSAALDGRLDGNAVEAIMIRAAKKAEAYKGSQQEVFNLFRAADAAEAVWMALDSETNPDDLAEAIRSATLAN